MVKLTRIGALIAAGPAEQETARGEILEMLESVQGNRTLAAAEFGVSVMTLRTWIDRLEMWGRVDALCVAHNFPVQKGPARLPRKSSE